MGTDWRKLLEQRLGPELEADVAFWTMIINAERPARGRIRLWRWRRHWQREEYRAFLEGGLYGSLHWCVIKRANERAGVWEPICTPRYSP